MARAQRKIVVLTVLCVLLMLWVITVLLGIAKGATSPLEEGEI